MDGSKKFARAPKFNATAAKEDLDAVSDKVRQQPAVRDSVLDGRLISWTDLSALVLVLHEAISGKRPDLKARRHYAEGTLIKEAVRLQESHSLEALQQMTTDWK